MAKKTTDQDEDKTKLLMVYVMGTCDELREKGLCDGGIKLTKDGRAFFEWLRDRGFQPSKQELEETMLYLNSVLNKGVTNGNS